MKKISYHQYDRLPAGKSHVGPFPCELGQKIFENCRTTSFDLYACPETKKSQYGFPKYSPTRSYITLVNSKIGNGNSEAGRLESFSQILD